MAFIQDNRTLFTEHRERQESEPEENSEDDSTR